MFQDQVVRRRLRKNRVKEYFYGKPHVNPLAPARIEIKLSTVKFLRAGGYQLSEGMRSMGDDNTSSSLTDLIEISPTADLLNSVLGVLNPLDVSTSTSRTTSGDDELSCDMMKSNIAGFIVVLQINLELNSMTILSPCPGMLPSKYLMVGSIKWVEK